MDGLCTIHELNEKIANNAHDVIVLDNDEEACCSGKGQSICILEFRSISK